MPSKHYTQYTLYPVYMIPSIHYTQYTLYPVYIIPRVHNTRSAGCTQHTHRATLCRPKWPLTILRVRWDKPMSILCSMYKLKNIVTIHTITDASALQRQTHRYYPHHHRSIGTDKQTGVSTIRPNQTHFIASKSNWHAQFTPQWVTTGISIQLLDGVHKTSLHKTNISTFNQRLNVGFVVYTKPTFNNVVADTTRTRAQAISRRVLRDKLDE